MVPGTPPLHYLEWKARGVDTLVLVHGNSANAWWWRWTVDALDGRYERVVALDLRGHGDSGWVSPPDYSPPAYGKDIARVIQALGIDHPVVAGHSMGGIATLAFAERFPALPRAVVAIDVAVSSSPRRNRYLRHLKALPTVVYPELSTALSKFRLMPQEGTIAPEVMTEVAERSLGRTTTGGYTMKFDRESFFGSDGLDVAAAIRRATVPLLLIRAELSRIMTVDAAIAGAESNPLARLATIRGAHHHLPLERPAELAAELLRFMHAPCGSLV
jgi:pimeloyl-ACP methyl ester carboxylesterase